jgi:hypothetical protein
MILLVPSLRIKIPFNRWSSKLSGCGSEETGAAGAGNFVSHRTVRSQASTHSTLSAEIGGVMMAVVEIA